MSQLASGMLLLAATIGMAAEQPSEEPPNPADGSGAEAPGPQWSVEGRVTDTRGQPVEGAAVRSACGWGTLFPSKPVYSDADGCYRLRLGAGWRDGGLQVATISVQKPGYAEINLYRQGDLLMGSRLPEKPSKWDPDRIILPNKPRRVDFTMVPAARVEGLLLDERQRPLPQRRIYLDGDQLPPSSSVASVSTTDDAGRFRFDVVAPDFAWWFSLAKADDFALPRTQAVQLGGGQVCQLVLQVKQHEGNKMLRIASLQDERGEDVLRDVLVDDPRAQPFLDPAATHRAREILTRVAEVNRDWFRSTRDDVTSFSYVFHLRDREPRPIAHADFVRATSWYREWYPKGISYTGGARVLASLRDRAKFRELDIGEEQIRIYFVLRGLPSTVAAGNGIVQTWSGFYNSRMIEGVLTLDAQRLTPIQIEYGERREVYSDYQQTSPDHYAPGRIRILSPGMNFDFRFRVYEPGMWMFDRSFGRWSDDPEQPVAWLTDVQINGRPGVVRERR